MQSMADIAQCRLMVTNDAVNIHFMVVSKQKKDSGQAYVSLAQTASTNGGGEPTEEENQ
jgi:hypothetical protein